MSDTAPLSRNTPWRRVIRPTAPSPLRHPFDPGDRDLWLPTDCGACPPCRARRMMNGSDVPVMAAGVQWDRMAAVQQARRLWPPREDDR
jgi:hypothetical protein